MRPLSKSLYANSFCILSNYRILTEMVQKYTFFFKQQEFSEIFKKTIEKISIIITGFNFFNKKVCHCIDDRHRPFSFLIHHKGKNT